MLTKLKFVRLQRGLKQYQVAASLGVTAPLVSMWENGRAKPNPQQLRALSELYKVEVHHLIEERS